MSSDAVADSLYDLLPPRPRSFEPPPLSAGGGEPAGGVRPAAGGAQARYFDVAPAFEALKGVRQAGGRRYCDGECLVDAERLTLQ